MGARRRGSSELPHAPLELLHPLVLPGAEIIGAAVVRELGRHGPMLMELLQAVLSWSAHPEHRPDLDSASLERTEYALLSRGPDPLASPAGLLAGYMARPETASQRDVAWACVCISDWAAEQGARGTAIEFAKAAAFAWPRHARYAWMVARMLRVQNRGAEAETWFRRAHRVAVWTDDWEAQSRTLNSLGNLNLAIGRFPLAKRLHLRARTVARRHSLTALQAEVTHDLFVTAAQMKAPEQAEMFAAEAFALYGRNHPRLDRLMHDVAQFWVEQGYFARAMPVLTVLIRRFNEPVVRIRALAAAAHASGALRTPETFERCWAEFWEATQSVSDHHVLASTLYNVGLGAAAAEYWDRAASTLASAVEHASTAGAHDISALAADALSRVHAGRPVDESAASRASAHSEPAGDRLAQGFLASLRSREPGRMFAPAPADVDQFPLPK